MHLLRQVIKDKGEGLVDRLGIDDMVIIENQCEGEADLTDIVDQAGQDFFARG